MNNSGGDFALARREFEKGRDAGKAFANAQKMGFCLMPISFVTQWLKDLPDGDDDDLCAEGRKLM